MGIHLFYPFASHAQRFNIQVYSLIEGIPQSQVISMMQDSRGYMWFGTYGGGVCMFDGLEFKYFTILNGLPNNSIWSLFEDSGGNIWLGTAEGAAKYDGYAFHIFNGSNGFTDAQVSAIMEDEQHNILLGTAEGLYTYKNSRFEKYITEEGHFEEDVFVLFTDYEGRLWTGTYMGGVHIIDKGKTKKLDRDGGLTSNDINYMWQDDDSTIWICTERGITTLKNDLPVENNLPGNIQSKRITSVMKDRYDNYWISTFSHGVYILNDNELKNITEKEGLSNNMTYKCLQDNAGDIWISTDGGGVCKYTNEAFTYYDKEQGLSNNLVMSILEDRKGNMWFGSDGGGIDMLSKDSIVSMSARADLSFKRVLALYEDDQGNIWIGTDGMGLFAYNGSDFIQPANSMQDQVIHAIHKSGDGSMWFGTENGIYRLSDNKISFIESDVEGMNETCWTIKEDRKGELWFGTDYGIVKYSNGRFRNFNKTDGLLSNYVICLETDSSGNMWIGTENGLSCFDGKSFTNYTVKDGLSSGNIYLMTFDLYGNLILGTDKGLNKITFSDDRHIEELIHYGYREGFTGIECNANAVCRKKDGSIWFGTIKGITKYDPQKEQKNDVAPNVCINGMQLFYETTDWRQYADSLSRWNNLPVNLTLPYNKNHLTFSYSAISFISPDKISYRFKLEGFDQNWSPNIKKKSTTYSNLPPGNYTFKVIACNGEGVCIENPASYRFSIDDPFWLEWWFIAPCVALAIAFAFAMFILFNRLHTARLRKAKKELETTVATRTLELQEKNAKL
ncbi:MAG: two-component regulator propeller domain-containing protein, partial [Flavobacteriales bacterium]